MRRPSLTAVTMLVFVALCAGSAAAWEAPFFEKSASAAATYEEMAIQPQALFDPVTDQTYIVYQGSGMDPYAMAYDHSREDWEGPYRIGSNGLGTNTHGAPALAIDPEGHVVVFYGGHGGPLKYARTAKPGDLSSWKQLGSVEVGESRVVINATYPQPVVEPGGSIRLYYRRDGGSVTQGDWESVVSTMTPKGSFAWSEPEMLLDGSPYSSIEPTTTGDYWYVNVDHDSDRGTAIVATRRDLAASRVDFRIRKGVYYLERSSEETWTAIGGVAVDSARNRSSLEVTAAVLPEMEGVHTNQAVLRRDAAGRPAVLYLVGSNDDELYEWRFSRWDGHVWNHFVICETDNFFDAGTFEFLPDGRIEAFLTTGGGADDQWLDTSGSVVDQSVLATRGGDISRWSSTNGSSWDKVSDVILSPGPQARYNNPQIVRGYRDGARLIFSEWNNDASNFIHKVFLWGADGLVQRSFTPEFHRLAGDTRIGTAVEISKQGFPVGAGAVVLAAAGDFPDVLCGVPLAQTLKAPVLLSGKSTLDEQVVAEIKRLNASRVIVLGGEKALSAEIERELRQLKNSRGTPLAVERIAGADRYETSALIAHRLATIRSGVSRVVLASGEGFADALAVSPYAARRGYPVLLTPSQQESTHTAYAVSILVPREIIVVGGEAAVASDVVRTYENSILLSPGLRIGGANRYATARLVADHALDGGHSLERFAVATGETFADAVGGGLLAARLNGVLLTTPSAHLHDEVVDLLDKRAFSHGQGVLDVFVLGGPAAIHPEVENSLAATVNLLDHEFSR